MLSLKKFNIICGHYGCGKTNLSINMAVNAAKEGKKVTIVDLDIVNPYFRTAEYKSLFDENNIELIAPQFAGSNLDVPSLPAEVNSVFCKPDRYIIIDVGGDDAGAFALGRYSAQIKNLPDFNMIYVINKYRSLTQNVEDTVQILKEIESASRLKANMIVNNSHLQGLTTVDTILNALEYGKKIEEILGIPLTANTAPSFIANKLYNKVKDLYPVEVFVKPIWA